MPPISALTVAFNDGSKARVLRGCPYRSDPGMQGTSSQRLIIQNGEHMGAPGAWCGIERDVPLASPLITIVGHGGLQALAGSHGAADCASHRPAMVFKITPSLVARGTSCKSRNAHHFLPRHWCRGYFLLLRGQRAATKSVPPKALATGSAVGNRLDRRLRSEVFVGRLRQTSMAWLRTVG
jgi:hypothetical protein